MIRRRPRLVIMVKVPRAGRVKTRLGREIGMAGAAWWFRHQVRSILRRVVDPRWETVLAVAPDKDLHDPFFPRHLPRIAQGPGNLGDRMRRVFRTLPSGPVCIIGADIPGIDRAAIAEAFSALGDHDAVFGPAPDGGYWLVGLKGTRAMPRSALTGVRWSTEHALTDSKASLNALRIATIRTLRDVDEAKDLAP